MKELLIGVRQAAEAVGLSHWTIRQYIREGKIRGVKIGKRMLVEPAELQRLVDEGRGKSSQKEHDYAGN